MPKKWCLARASPVATFCFPCTFGQHAHLAHLECAAGVHINLLMFGKKIFFGTEAGGRRTNHIYKLQLETMPGARHL